MEDVPDVGAIIAIELNHFNDGGSDKEWQSNDWFVTAVAVEKVRSSEARSLPRVTPSTDARWTDTCHHLVASSPQVQLADAPPMICWWWKPQPPVVLQSYNFNLGRGTWLSNDRLEW